MNQSYTIGGLAEAAASLVQEDGQEDCCSEGGHTNSSKGVSPRCTSTESASDDTANQTGGLWAVVASAGVGLRS